MSVHLQPDGAAAMFCGGLSAAESHRGLKQALTVLQSAEKCAVLWFAEILRRKLYRDLGYSSIHLYASEALGFGPSRISQFIRLAESFENLPVLKASVASGELSWTKAREVARVATTASEKAWVAEAKVASRLELERKVAQAKEASRRERRADPAQQSLVELMAPPAHAHDIPARVAQAPMASAPVTLSFRMDALQLARFDGLMEKLRKLGLDQAKEELLLEALAGFAESVESSGKPPSGVGSAGAPNVFQKGDFPRGNVSPHQIIIYQCERCGEAQTITSRGSRRLPKGTLERVECDARILESDGMNRATIPPATRRAVLARDRHRCRVQGCNHSRFLEVHHVKPRSEGGSNKPENLVTLCSACHQLLHEKGTKLPMRDPTRG